MKHMRRWWSALVVVPAAVGASTACDLDLEPYVDPVDGGQQVVLTDSGKTDAQPREDGGGAVDAGVDADPKDATADAGTVKRVFVTSSTVNGSLGGVAGADTRCQQLAAAANLGGTFVAWVSVAGQPAPTRILGAGPWFLVDKKTRVFASKLAMTTTGPEIPIDIDEKGAKIGNPNQVWTGTQFAGTASNNNCNNFTSPIGNGLTGEADKTAAQWTQSANLSCTQPLRLYCIEQ